ncbi:hypothetical protein VNO80_33914 [Phaseolus coccineus]|uniref:Uncharacterized protein n=1 Tax=Phaseolus coccineus TaxID=3886 RepID=A0AAN9QC54_PHACN
MLEKSILFKADSRNDQGIRFEQSFRVKKDLYEQNAKHSKGKHPVNDVTCVKITEMTNCSNRWQSQSDHKFSSQAHKFDHTVRIKPSIIHSSKNHASCN